MFTEDYKRQAIELAVPSGRSVMSVAKELGLRGSVLRRWVHKCRREPASAPWRPTTQATSIGDAEGIEVCFGTALHDSSRVEKTII
ncbi:transposase [Bradyrhizobium glycinis]|uniref:transposase n=1 Tax=Bradyrhizobium glycinis TaxID=2751812 RepID=UPI0018D8BF60|nr:transposase [Bradyrhizobium glycinis]MBH5373486.1 transposase [Bradyrhizobium glycinis]